MLNLKINTKGGIFVTLLKQIEKLTKNVIITKAITRKL